MNAYRTVEPREKWVSTPARRCSIRLTPTGICRFSRELCADGLWHGRDSAVPRTTSATPGFCANMICPFTA